MRSDSLRLRALFVIEHSCLTRPPKSCQHTWVRAVPSMLWTGYLGAGVKGYIIYDVAEEVYRPSVGLPCNRWGMIAVTSPNENKYKLWACQNLPLQIVMNCPDESDVRGMRVWEQRSKPPQQQAEYWREVRGRMDKVGPILRHIFDEQSYDDRIEKCRETVEETISPETQYYTGLGNSTMWGGSSVFHWLAKVVRIREEACKGGFSLNLPISDHLCNKTLCMLAKLMQQDDFNSLIETQA
ncbi:putative retrotransposon hot spot (RHS) protein [Trypanosoma cruzi]|uniref:Putative retrotransposon hot spot (RHS) protein n=1 Tax=Trypanosoma cruzi TaxID=5693 RepID=A0A2V2VK75_TRYCR|nr:putative retrotransposon hot spot (RHS) protein [Trypanosoma cruzi]